MDLIKNDTVRMIKAVFKSYAKELGVESKDIQLIIFKEKEDEPEYLILKDSVIHKRTDFDDLLFRYVKLIDIYARKKLAPPFLAKKLDFYADRYEVTPKNFSFYINAEDNDLDLQFWAYDLRTKEYIDTLDLNEVLNLN